MAEQVGMQQLEQWLKAGTEMVEGLQIEASILEERARELRFRSKQIERALKDPGKRSKGRCEKCGNKRSSKAHRGTCE